METHGGWGNEVTDSNTTFVKVKFYNQICVPTIR